MKKKKPEICGVDVFCGVGGLSRGLLDAGVGIVAGIDVDPACRYAYEKNIGATFIEKDIAEVRGAELSALLPPDAISLLAGCAPCQPFSKLRIGRNTTREAEWSLLDEFGRLVQEMVPDLVTMENVPELKSKVVFARLLDTLDRLKYDVHWVSIRCARIGVPQTRRRLVLIGSRIGPIAVPRGELKPEEYRTVRQTIGKLPRLASGERHHRDRLHAARNLAEVNLRRIRAAVAGGTWEDWPDDLKAPCHRKKSGRSFRSVYARMEWDGPAPTITTQAYNFGTGRFGHPEQDRAITLREAAMLQTFPRSYAFLRPQEPVNFESMGRLIGNAVPPLLGYHIGRALTEAIGA